MPKLGCRVGLCQCGFPRCTVVHLAIYCSMCCFNSHSLGRLPPALFAGSRGPEVAARLDAVVRLAGMDAGARARDGGVDVVSGGCSRFRSSQVSGGGARARESLSDLLDSRARAPPPRGTAACMGALGRGSRVVCGGVDRAGFLGGSRDTRAVAGLGRSVGRRFGGG